MTTPLSRDLKLLPNVITLARLVLMVVGVAIYQAGYYGPGIIAGIVAGLTDYLDGYLARRMGLVSPLGEILDQMADNIFEVALFLIAMSMPTAISPLFLLIYLAREFWVTGIRRYMVRINQNIPSSIWGKVKTNVVMWSFVFTIYGGSIADGPLAYEAWVFGQIALCAGLAFSLFSGWQYTRAFVEGYNRATEA